LRNEITLPAEIGLAEQPETANIRLEVSAENPLSHWIYALVAPFPTIPDGVAHEDLVHAWIGKASGSFAGLPLRMTPSTLGTLTALWGAPAEDAVKLHGTDELLDKAWEGRPAWAIVPFERLEPRWKVLQIDGVSPIQKGFEPQQYALTVPISLIMEADSVSSAAKITIPSTNRNPGRLTTLMMTGVTALVRATAHTMELQGVTYPARDIGSWLREADLTHISNEVPFAKDCPYPNPVQADMRFCSDTRYIGLLEEVGTDIVELTGDHFSDWGAEAMLYTLELYDQRDWPYYGGGANLSEARQAVILEHNGNRLAFIGCNAKGGGYAQASASHPGAGACDFAWMESEIERLRSEGYLPIATFQHFEYYTYVALPNQTRDAQRLTEAGAVIVSGSQAHHPQAFEFSDGVLVHHGLGNLFFDQLDVSEATRQAFIDRHVFYKGRHISTELLSILFIDYARPRPMTPEERQRLLSVIFSASGW
jgi:poly-gamma-glutamate synthesis protein (capsule biosynthesis protein)